MTPPDPARAARLTAIAAERNTPRSNLLAAIKSLAARHESHPKEWGPAQVKSAQLEAISTFERVVTAELSAHVETLTQQVAERQHQACALANSVEWLQQENARLTADLERVERECFEVKTATYLLQEKAEQQRDAAHAALTRYGQHQGICSNFPERTVCTCGLDAALAASAPQKE